MSLRGISREFVQTYFSTTMIMIQTLRQIPVVDVHFATLLCSSFVLCKLINNNDL